jgi:4-aminobutyrate aminotransferase-like enzyme
MEKYTVIGDVRGKGLMVAIELVTDRETKEPAKERTAAVFETAKDLGLLIGKGGLDGNIIRITPPMCIHEADIDFLLEVLDCAFEQTEAS